MRKTISRTFRFYKNKDSRWYVDLPEWKGDTADLEMVAGADILCDLFAQGEEEVYIGLSNDPVLYPRGEATNLGKKESEGMWYTLDSIDSIKYNLDFWLYNITKFVFDEFPNKIYFY